MNLIFKQPVTEVSLVQKDRLGDLRLEDGKWYKYVKLLNITATVAGVAGDPVAYTAAGAGILNHTVVLDCSDADSQPICAGFLMGTVAGVHSPATSYYIWVQITGRVVVPTAVGSGVVGSHVRLTSTDKTLGVMTGVLGNCGVEATATAANNVIIADCPR